MGACPYRARQGRSRGSVPLPCSPRPVTRERAPTVLAKAGHAGACPYRARQGRSRGSVPLPCSPRPVTRERAPYRARQGRSRGSVPPTVLARAGHAGACPLPCSPGSGQASITDETSVLHFQANGFHFGVTFEDFAAHLAAPSGLFISAKRERGVKDVIAVDPN